MLYSCLHRPLLHSFLAGQYPLCCMVVNRQGETQQGWAADPHPPELHRLEVHEGLFPHHGKCHQSIGSSVFQGPALFLESGYSLGPAVMAWGAGSLVLKDNLPSSQITGRHSKKWGSPFSQTTSFNHLAFPHLFNLAALQQLGKSHLCFPCLYCNIPALQVAQNLPSWHRAKF